MKIGILGAGAVGGYFGGKLIEAGHDVGFIARGETLDVLRSTGLTLTDAQLETTVLHPIATATDFIELREALGGLDAIIIATKSLPDNATFGEGLSASELAEVPIVTTHNSVEVHDRAAELFGADRVLAGVVRGYMVKEGPAKVRFHAGPFSLNFGLLPAAKGQWARDVAERLAEALHEAGADSKVFDDIAVDIWTKAMFVTTTGELGALADKPMGYLRGPLREQLVALMREVEAAGRGVGVDLPADIVDKNMAFADKQLETATSSMQRDIRDGLPNELDSQVGAICRMGRRGGVPTPLHDMVYGVLQARTTGHDL